MKVLFVSNLFPNKCEISRGVFNLPRMVALSQFAEVQVVAPVAWLPIKGFHAPTTGVPAQETISGVTVYHPRQYYLPKIGRPLNPLLFAWSVYPLIKRIQRNYPFDILHVDWAYPDGCGMAKIARWLDLPFAILVAGSDVNVYMQWRIRRFQIRRMMEQSSVVIARSLALANVLKSNGVPPQKIQTIYNGVDCDLYRPLPRAAVRRSLGIPTDEATLIYVGRLAREKRVEDLLSAVAILEQMHNKKVRLLVVGSGPLRSSLEKRAIELGINGHVHWFDAQPPAKVVQLINAANALCLCSIREGVPNVLMEAMACGVPVVATRVGGIPEVIPEFAGILVSPDNPEEFAKGIASALTRTWSLEQIRAHAARFSWLECGRKFYEVFVAAVAAHKTTG